ncbi:LysE family translocator [Pseudoalteromonas denitrificans]|jgi:threonine/homoserine/homoserine lactone efflux protein|uniref:Threonine/homoserine/homoserine lactone efflux protein n=1 Tax=Pseudoalteromonas denitrificans DSM 6059 TaxID=1123010 RepID=A0A1I1PXQ5_9GAMM|nr:LysE family translocator [Pseudoalteromonas denitrificans]SFD14701.1 Threonine/homoserine/homoserine lactone efflux protein [Pseudoalteromonas denitrificans DSM 6059]
MEIQLLLSLAVIHSVALASPGPDFALVVKIASQERRTTAIAAAIGISVAILFHTLLSLTGVSLLIKSSDVLFVIVQLIGASYLGWMGINAIRSALNNWRKSQVTIIKNNKTYQLSIKKGFLLGLYTNLLNPKAFVFFITLFSTLITPEVNLITKISATIILLSLSLLWFILIAFVLSKPKIQQQMQKATPTINLITGILFLSVTIVILSGLS